MAYKILFTDDALVDLEVVLDYIRAGDSSAAEQFGISLLNHVEVLQRFRRIGVPVRKRPENRKILHTLARIHYRLHEDRSLIEVLHFCHSSREEAQF